MAQWRNAAPGHKMFIATERNLLAAKCEVVKSEWLKRKPPPEWAAVSLGAM